MTQTPPLDLEAVQLRYALTNDTVPGETGETDAEYRQRVDQEMTSRAWGCVEDVPDLVAEICRLQFLLHPGNHYSGWEAAREALLHEAEGWHKKGNPDRSSALSVAAETLGRLDYRPKGDSGELWTDNGWRNLARNQIRELRAKDQLIQRLEEASAQDQTEIDRLRAALDHVRLQGHLLLPDDPDRDQRQPQATVDRLRGMVRERDAIIEGQDRDLNAVIADLGRRPHSPATCTTPSIHGELDADGFCESCGAAVV